MTRSSFTARFFFFFCGWLFDALLCARQVAVSNDPSDSWVVEKFPATIDLPETRVSITDRDGNAVNVGDVKVYLYKEFETQSVMNNTAAFKVHMPG